MKKGDITEEVISDVVVLAVILFIFHLSGISLVFGSIVGIILLLVYHYAWRSRL
jgi:hypothetical protein